MLGSTGRALLSSHKLLPAITCPKWGLAWAAPRRGRCLPAALGSLVLSAWLWNVRVSAPQGMGRRNFQIFLYLLSSGKRNVQYSSPTSDTSCWGLTALPARSTAPKPSPLAAAAPRGTAQRHPQLSEPHLALLHFAANSPFSFMFPGAYLGWVTVTAWPATATFDI